MKIGIFGGSFDPVHLEHLALCKAAIESLLLDRLFVVPAHTPPHKQGKSLSSDRERLKLCALAFQGEEKIEVSDYEIAQGGTSYTYLTVRAFREKFPTDELYFLVGTDMLRNFPSWKNPSDILSNATLAVCARDEKSGWAAEAQKEFYERFHTSFFAIGYNGLPVSSTRIRVLAAAGEDISPLVGDKVAAYIEERGLYALRGAKEALLLQKETRKAHSLRVAAFAAEHALSCGVEEKKAIEAALFHDCAKNLALSSPYLAGFVPPQGVPADVVHQYAGAFVAERVFGVNDQDVLNAIRYHTSGRADMSPLEKLVFLADMLEESRSYPEVEELRTSFARDGLNACLTLALKRTIEFLTFKGAEIYPLTLEAYQYMQNTQKGELL